jgi:hypothetical protein
MAGRELFPSQEMGALVRIDMDILVGASFFCSEESVSERRRGVGRQAIVLDPRSLWSLVHITFLME